MAKFMNAELTAIRDNLCCGHCGSIFAGSDSQSNLVHRYPTGGHAIPVGSSSFLERQKSIVVWTAMLNLSSSSKCWKAHVSSPKVQSLLRNVQPLLELAGRLNALSAGRRFTSNCVGEENSVPPHAIGLSWRSGLTGGWLTQKDLRYHNAMTSSLIEKSCLVLLKTVTGLGRV